MEAGLDHPCVGGAPDALTTPRRHMAGATRRAMVGLLAPTARLAEFFGLWTFAVRLAAIVGPVTYGMVTWLTGGNHRLAILSTAAPR